jgi:hypothetical protein
MLPIMVIKRIFLRPYLSDRDPMCGDTRNWSVLMEQAGETRQCQPDMAFVLLTRIRSP